MLNSLDQRTKVLLAVVLCLVIARFAVVPLVEWQNKQLAASRELSTRISKAERLISSGQSEEVVASLGDQIKQLKARYFIGLSNLDLQLQLDERIDDSISTFNLRLQRRAWRFDREDYITAEVRLSLSGTWLGLVKWVHYLENQQKFAEIRELSINPSRGNNNNEITANIVIQYRVLNDDV